MKLWHRFPGTMHREPRRRGKFPHFGCVAVAKLPTFGKITRAANRRNPPRQGRRVRHWPMDSNLAGAGPRRHAKKEFRSRQRKAIRPEQRVRGRSAPGAIARRAPQGLGLGVGTVRHRPSSLGLRGVRQNPAQPATRLERHQDSACPESPRHTTGTPSHINGQRAKSIAPRSKDGNVRIGEAEKWARRAFEAGDLADPPSTTRGARKTPPR